MWDMNTIRERGRNIMKLKNKFGKRLLSVILSATVAISATLPFSLTALADSTGSAVVTSAGAASSGWAYNGNTGVLRFNASAIADELGLTEYDNPKYRYGNGEKISVINYPLFMLTGKYLMNTGVSHHADSIDWGNVIADMRTEYNYWNNKSTYDGNNTRRTNVGSSYGSTDRNSTKWTKEFTTRWEDYGIPSNANKQYKVVDYSNKVADGSSCYMEDILGVALSRYDANKLSKDDMYSLWYFYTRLGAAANSDISLWSESTKNRTSNLGNKLQERMSNVKQEAERVKKFKRGYIVAMALAYGDNSAVVRNLIGNENNSENNFDTTKTTNQLWHKAYKSFYVERCEVIPIHLNSADGFYLLSVHDYLELINKANNSNKYKNTFRDWQVISNTPVRGTEAHSLAYGCFDIIAEMIQPTRSGVAITDGGEKQYGGWGYYQFEDTDEVPIPPTQYIFDPEINIGTEITYNAFLTSNDSYSEESSYGNNGHVATDTVYISEPHSIKDIYYSMDNSIKDTKVYMLSAVDKSISLSTPVVGTSYRLDKISYQIVNANGAYSSGTNNGVENLTIKDKNSDNVREYLVTKNTSGTAINSTKYNSTKYDGTIDLSDTATVAISGKDINSATSDSNGILKYRIAESRTNPGLTQGYWSKDGVNHAYTVTLSSKISDSAKITYVQNGSHKSTTKLSDLFNTSSIGGYNTEISSIKDGITKIGKFSGTDTDENSTNLLYVTLSDGVTSKKVPAYYMNGIWYFCPLISYDNVLVQIRADYVANYSTDAIKNNIFQTVDMKEYLLSETYSTNDFVKSNKTIYTLIDNYATNQWGTLYTRTAKYYAQDDSSSNISLFDLAGDDSVNIKNRGTTSEYYNFSRGSNVDKYGNLGNWRDSFYWYTSPSLQWNDSFFHVSTSTMTIGGLTRRVAYIDTLEKLSPNFINNSSKTNTFVNQSLPVKVQNYAVGVNFIKYTGENANDKAIKTILSYTGKEEGTKTTVPTLITNIRDSYNSEDFDANSQYPHFPAERTVTAKRSLSVNLTSTKFTNNKTGYAENYFTKILVSYQKYLKAVKGKLSSSSVPNIAIWDSTSVAKASDLGMTTSYKGKSISNTTYDAGFIRFGQSTANGHLRLLLNNDGTPTGITPIATVTAVDTQKVTASAYQDTDYTMIQPSTQSSIDVPIKFNLKTFTPTSPTSQTVTTKTSVSGSTISETAQYNSEQLKLYPQVMMFSQSQKEDGTKTYSTVKTVGAKQRTVPLVTYSTVNLNNLNVDAKVTGTAVAFDTRAKALADSLGSSDVQVLYSGSGIKAAVSTKSSGSARAFVLDILNTSVADGETTKSIKSSWGNTVAPATAAKSSLQNVVDKLDSNLSANMAIYNGTDLKTVDLPVSDSASIGISNTNTTEINYQLTVRSGVLTRIKVYDNALTGSNVVRYYKVVNGVVSLESNVKTDSKYNYINVSYVQSMVNGLKLVGSDNVLKNAFVSNAGVKIPSDIATHVANNWSDVDKLVNGVNRMQTTNGWYNEDTDFLVVREYTADIAIKANQTITDQLPLTIGPATPSDKNKYFSNGYKGFVNATIEIKGKSTAPSPLKDTVIATATTKKKAKSGSGTVTVNSATTAELAIPDFIIADVTINEVTGY